METIRVNMTPCEDVQTIHASQNDNEAREWGFELHNNGEKIDSSSISDQLVFKTYEGGTEQILPENGSTPTTSPFIGDIKYPQGLLTDQEFLYRESPTEEDGLANIVGIKGQTLKWNQFCCKGRYFTRGNNEWQNTYTENGVTFTYLDDYTVRIAGTPTARTYIYLNRLDDSANYPVKQGEKLLLRCSNAPNGIDIFSSLYLDNTWKGAGPQKSNKYVTVPPDVNKLVCMGIDVQASLVGQTIDVTLSLNVFNLTKMFGSGNEPTEEEFNALFPIYYPYNSGSLIPFNGNGIKTVGKNLLNSTLNTITVSGVTCTKNDDGSFTFNGTATTDGYFRLVDEYQFNAPSSVYVSVVSSNNGLFANFGIDKYDSSIADSSSASLGRDLLNNHPSNIRRIWVHTRNSATYDNVKIYPMIRFTTVSDNTFEPYTSSTLSLPISTYFPNGMKSIEPNQYTTVEITDELIPTKATTRVGSITIDGNTPMNPNGATSVISAFIIPINGKANGRYNIMSDLFEVADGTLYAMLGRDGNNNVQFGLPPSVPQTSADGKAWFAEHPTTLYFELATPTETSFTTASLVTENAEIPLSNEDGVLIGKCTEQLSAEPGFHDAKIKLANDDGECYSNKLQLHIERSPQ